MWWIRFLLLQKLTLVNWWNMVLMKFRNHVMVATVPGIPGQLLVWKKNGVFQEVGEGMLERPIIDRPTIKEHRVLIKLGNDENVKFIGREMCSVSKFSYDSLSSNKVKLIMCFVLFPEMRRNIFQFILAWINRSTERLEIGN